MSHPQPNPSTREASRDFTDAELEAFLDEALPSAEMARLETTLRDDPTAMTRLAEIARRRDSDHHSLGDIWRRERISCPTREQLGSFLLGALDESHQRYVEFHLQTIGCRLCQANLDDLRREEEGTTETASRRRKFVRTSAGYLRRKRSPERNED